ncbi:hypothetical protein [uncultured Friedmanniella sp.]|uniref:hypothetical protein n=1 Tax=uncultured Friedmanniella sp. TaxID=335381 RepID=UPI0035CC1C69
MLFDTLELLAAALAVQQRWPAATAGHSLSAPTWSCPWCWWEWSTGPSAIPVGLCCSDSALTGRRLRRWLCVDSLDEAAEVLT